MKTILVTGDVVVYHHIYEGQRYTASASDQRGVKVVRQHGGAKGLTNLINAVIDQTEVNWSEEKTKREQSLQNAEETLRAVSSSSKDSQEIATAEQGVEEARRKLEPPSTTGWSAQFGLTLPSESAQPCGHHALAIWKPFPEEPSEPKNKEEVWRAELLMGYGHDDSPPGDRGGYEDVPKFNEILNQNIAFTQAQIIESLAPAIHETWRRLSEEEGWKMQPHFDKPYKELEEVDKEENRAAARRIPESWR